MGAKRKRKDTDGQRMRRHLVSLHAKTRANLEALNVDVDAMFSEDPVARRQVHKASQQLVDMATIMRARVSYSTSTAPTPERLAHTNEPPREIEISPAQAKAHQLTWQLEAIRDKLTTRQYEAAERFHKARLLMQPRSAVADTTGAGGASDPSKRLPLTEAQEYAAREFNWIMSRLEGEFTELAENFVLEVPRQGSERCLTIEEWGTRKLKFGRDRNYGAGVAAIRLVCERLAYLGSAYGSWQKEQCARTDRLMKSGLGRRAGRDGWICALWAWCHRHGKLPLVQGDLDEIRARHDEEARRLRHAPPMELERWHRNRDRLTSLAFRADDKRTRAVG